MDPEQRPPTPDAAESAPPPAAEPAVPSDPAGLAYDEEPPQHVPGSFLGAMPQFFVFPAILVATLLGVYLILRGLVGSEAESAEELLRRARGAGPHERWQVLHALADGLGRGNLDLAAVPTAELRELYAAQVGSARTPLERADLHRCLLQIVAHKRDPALTPLALSALDDPDPEVRKGALFGLAIMADPAAFAPLAARLEQGPDDERLLALGALGNLVAALPAVRDALAERLLDRDTVLARNAALLLAGAGDARAAPFLLHMLTREGYAGDARLEGGLSDEDSRAAARQAAVEQFLVSACRAAGKLGLPESIPLLRGLRAGDPSMKVRSAAIDALHDLGAVAES